MYLNKSNTVKQLNDVRAEKNCFAKCQKKMHLTIKTGIKNMQFINIGFYMKV